VVQESRHLAGGRMGNRNLVLILVLCSSDRCTAVVMLVAIQSCLDFSAARQFYMR